MNTCYDGRDPVKLIVLLAVLSLPAQAQLWHATVAPPRPALPTVSIDLGYPGPYLPPLNVPIALHANAGALRFDGYIGYHFEVDGHQTLDTPVITRAIVAQGSPWSFETMLTMRKWGGTQARAMTNRELVIEWRDRAMRLVGTKPAGVPQWLTPMPLRIRAVAQLSDRAQWYAGFSSVIAPVDAWIDLPRGVRDAILGSGISIVFVGFPRSNQRLDDLDRALLPVTFRATPASYVRPWPYGTSHAAAPMSWRANDGADFIASATCPYIVSTNAATWIADDVALSRPLPAMLRSADWRTTVEILDDPYVGTLDYRPAALSGAMLLMSGVAWLFVRKRSRIAVVVALVALTLAIVSAERRRIRPPAGIVDRVMRLPAAPGIVDELHVLQEHGPAPLPEHAADRKSITGDFGFPEVAELRGPQTAASMGELHHAIDWDSTLRWTYRRRLAPSVASQRFVLTSFGDFHGAMSLWQMRRPSAGQQYLIGSTLEKRSDGRVWSTFALPPDTSGNVTVIVPGILAKDEIEINSAAGTATLKTTRRNAYAPPTAAIPDALLHDIAGSGGIFEIAVTPAEAVVKPNFHATIRVQEKKS